MKHTFRSEQFVNYWIHIRHNLSGGRKMSKSLGNFYVLQDLIDKGFAPLAYRYLCLTVRYRSKFNFTWEGLQAAQTALFYLKREMYYWDEPSESIPGYDERFLEPVNDDLNMPRAIAVVWDLVKSDYPTASKHATLLKWDKVLGLRLDEPFVPLEKEISLKNLPPEVGEWVKERERQRRDGNFEEADKLRGEIKKLGFAIEDTLKGTRVFRIGS